MTSERLIMQLVSGGVLNGLQYKNYAVMFGNSYDAKEFYDRLEKCVDTVPSFLFPGKIKKFAGMRTIIMGNTKIFVVGAAGNALRGFTLNGLFINEKVYPLDQVIGQCACMVKLRGGSVTTFED